MGTKMWPAAFQFTPDNVSEWIERLGPLVSVEVLNGTPQHVPFDLELKFGGPLDIEPEER